MTLKQELIEETEGGILKCFNCGMCAGSCPTARVSNHNPRKIVRKILLDQDVNDDIWLCANCFTCSARCPKGVDIPKIIDHLKVKAMQSSNNHNIIFNKAFLRGVRMFGRLYEAGFLAEFNMRDTSIKSIKRKINDISLIPHFLLKGKLGFLPRRIKNPEEVNKIFEKVKELEARK
ncbi:MAG: hypothetical protein A7316_07055 [Candidatus Altiarchaeales archaeon WOR_SM1_86-2]|nr:MAG: hypothetical protein A7315_05465 [Candidatus Altiarchaeales archaeon WOR_SM1_79]ODS38795.1 MAG: hypothetical protein A7316_07055 [Candidatus Altiarchaeales archaeon WOR_SM1_86-2]